MDAPAEQHRDGARDGAGDGASLSQLTERLQTPLPRGEAARTHPLHSSTLEGDMLKTKQEWSVSEGAAENTSAPNSDPQPAVCHLRPSAPAHCHTRVHKLSCPCMGLVINLQTHQQYDESVPRQDHVSSPPSWAAFKIRAVEVVTGRESSKHCGTSIVHQAGTESWEEYVLIIRDNTTPTAYTVSFALWDVPRVFSPCPILHVLCTDVTFPCSLSAGKKPCQQVSPSRGVPTAG